MAHQRQVIREAVKAQLLGRTAAGPRVFETRELPLKRLELPALSVYALEEAVDAASASTAPRELKRRLQLAIEGVVVLGADIDDALDALALQVERAVDADETFGGAASDSILTSTEIGIKTEAERPTGHIRLTYAVTYFTDAPAAADQPTLQDFLTADVKTNLSGTTAPGNQAEDRVTVRVP